MRQRARTVNAGMESKGLCSSQPKNLGSSLQAKFFVPLGDANVLHIHSGGKDGQFFLPPLFLDVLQYEYLLSSVGLERQCMVPLNGMTRKPALG